MSKSYWLRALQMGVARQNCRLMFSSHRHQLLLQRFQSKQQMNALIATPELKIGCDLIIT
ncbi:Uncharacterised protein [Vibrio cholerae]|nr:Uncharacterised protein [Vibrio cholerae]CSD58943.1 Uncharacterised protein [Vibrio cholerae]CSI06669.1 Uncharacterised protein [Vibrio cholerae]